MSVALTNLKLSRDQIAAQIVALTASYSPDSNIDGQSVPHGQQLDRLTKQFDEITKLIVKLEPVRVLSQVL